MLDKEQVSLFIFDNMCKSSSVKQMVDARRRFSLEKTQRPKVKLQAASRQDVWMRRETLQTATEIKRALKPMRPVELKGVFKGLWDDIERKKERLSVLRRELEER